MVYSFPASATMHDCSGCVGYNQITRRRMLGRLLEGAGASFLGLITPRLLYAAPGAKAKADSVILLWMAGGMSHIDTFDPQPKTDQGGPFAAIKTRAEGILIGEHLPLLAEQFKHLSVIRSVTGNEGEHGRASYVMHTGYPPIPTTQHSSIGSITAKELGPPVRDRALPPYVSIGIGWAAGYLGPKYAPFQVNQPDRAPANLAPHEGVDPPRFERRKALLDRLDASFRRQHPDDPLMEGYAHAYNAALLMMRPETAGVFDLSREPAALREAYGLRDSFGQGCLLARRLVERGVRFVEVALGGWDTHQDNFERVKELSGRLDRGAATLIQDLQSRGLLERTIVLVASEFGRTPDINERQGRDHFSRCWSTVIGGGGIAGGRVVGRSDKGRGVEARPVQVGHLHATLCAQLGIDFTKSNKGDGRPFRIVKDAEAGPVKELLS